MSLERYRSVARSRRIPSYLRTSRRRLGKLCLADLGVEELWSIHDNPPDAKTGPSLLDLKIELAERMMRACAFCERRCGADRAGGEVGFCGVGADSYYFFEQILWAEEAPVIPSHVVFFSGCNMCCKFCYSWESILNPERGSKLEPEELAGLTDFRREEGAANLNLLGGEPTPHLPNILRALKSVTRPTAIVWNSNFLMSRETMRLLDGIVDLYLGDFRFGNDRCSSLIGGTERYSAVARRNFKLAADTSDVIIRHLLLPGHIECCLRPIAEWVAGNLPDTPFNLMFQYLPCFEAEGDPVLGRSLAPDEVARAGEIVRSLGLNTKRWNRPLFSNQKDRPIGRGEFRTTIAVRPDGRVSIMHLHGELRDLVAALKGEGNNG